MAGVVVARSLPPQGGMRVLGRLAIVREGEAEVDGNQKRAQALRQAVSARAFGRRPGPGPIARVLRPICQSKESLLQGLMMLAEIIAKNQPTRPKAAAQAVVLHDHQAHPHVHISVRAESKHGTRLNPRKAELHRWGETFAEKLRGWGVEAEAKAIRQATRGATRQHPALWQLKAAQDGRLRNRPRTRRTSAAVSASREQAMQAWSQIGHALDGSADAADRRLAAAIRGYVREAPRGREAPEAARGAVLEAQMSGSPAPQR